MSSKYRAGPKEILMVLSIALIIFILSIWRTRGGVETVVASRYVVIVFSIFSLIIFTGMKELQNILSRRNIDIHFQKIFLVFFLITAVFRGVYWWQAPLDVNYQSQLNRNAVVELICKDASNLILIEKISKQDGLPYLAESLKSSLWSGFKKENCSN